MTEIKRRVNCDNCGSGMLFTYDVGFEPMSEREKNKLRKRLRKDCNDWLREHKCKS